MKKRKLLLIAPLILPLLLASCNNQPQPEPQPQPVEPEVDEYELVKGFEKVFYPQDAFLESCATVDDGGSANGTAIGNFTYAYSCAKYNIEVPVSTFYVLEVKYKCDSSVNYALFVNEENKYDLGFNGNNSYRSSKLMVKLEKGNNTLKIRNVQGRGYSANIDTVKVSAFSSVATIGLFFNNKTVYSHQNKVLFDCPVGFEYKINSSSNEAVINKNGDILDFSADREVTLQMAISRGENETKKSVTISVRKASPSASSIAQELFSQENNMIVPAGKTGIKIPNLYEDTEAFLTYSSNELVLSRNGVVIANKDDTNVKVKYTIRKADGSEAVTDEITYIVKGLGFEYNNYFENPLAVGQDPFLSYVDGYYYHIYSSHNSLKMIRSTSPIDYGHGVEATLFGLPASGWNCAELWGPFSLMKWSDGHYYIYYAADDGNNYHHREGVIRSKTTDPMGEYEDLGMINTSDEEDNENPTLANTKWAIGAVTYQHTDGDWYLTWSGWKNENDGFPQRSYIAKIHSPTKIGARVEISQPTEAWEGVNDGSPLQEGQAIFRVGDKVFLVYSANASWAGRYSLGVLLYNEKYDGGLLNPFNWVKVLEPAFVTTEYIESPGGPTIVPSPDGKEYWLLYHCSIWRGSGWTRIVCAKPIRFDEETGYPIFDDPIPLYSIMRTPSGDDIDRYDWDMFEAENMTLAGNVKRELNNLAHGGEYVKGFIKEGDSISMKYIAKEYGQYTVRIGYNAITEGSSHVLKINKKSYAANYLYRGQDSNTVIEIMVAMNEGENDISLQYVEGYDIRIDFIGIKQNDA